MTASDTAPVCPPCPPDVPADLRRPTARYRRLAAASALVLVVALVAYVALMLWFGWTGVQLVWSGMVLHDRAMNYPVGLGALLVAGVLASSFVRRRERPDFDDVVTVTEAEQPTLFAFLRQVAREVGAPMPDRVVLVASVDAAVVTVPGRWWRLERQSRTLVLGLGLVAGLDVRELKALVAHELGHLGHLSTALGRWSQRGFVIADMLIQPRQLPVFELPVIHHWVILVPFVLLLVARATFWAITALTTTLFGWVIRVQRAFERACEHEADLAAVAVAGSDAASTLLFRTKSLRERNAMAHDVAHRELARGRAVVDLFALQARIAARLPGIKGEPGDGVPPAPAGDPARHRVFTPALAALPTTWHSHPPDDEREHAMKARYVAAPADPREAWTAFDDVAALRAQVTARVCVRPAWEAPLAATPIEQSLEALDRELDRPSLAPRFRGLYLERGTTRIAPRTEPLGVSDPRAALAGLDEEALAEDVTARRRLRRDLAAIDGLLLGVLVARGRTVRYRDRDYRRAELPTLRATLEAELNAVNQRLAEREAYTRVVHRQLAATLSPAWAESLRSLWALWRWAEHSHAVLAEALAPVIERGLVHGELREADRVALQQLGHELAMRFAQLHGSLSQLQLPPGVATRLRNPHWFAAFTTPLPMPPPYGDLSGWLHYVLQIAPRAVEALDDGRLAARDELLALEERVAAMTSARTDEVPTEVAPPAARVPAHYATSEATVPAIGAPTWRARWRDPLRETGRVTIAVAMIGGLAVATHFLRKVDVVAYNGTGGPVTITIDGERRVVAGGGHARFRVGAGRVAVAARTADGKPIEAFHERIDERHRYVYDVAAALPLHEQTVVYSRAGDEAAPAPRTLPLRRWHAVRVDWLFETPAETREISTGERTRFSLIAPLPDEHPATALGALDDAAGPDAEAVLEAQLRWRPSDARFATSWWFVGTQRLAGAWAILEHRLARAPDDPLLRHVESAFAGDRRDAVCADHRARAAARPDDPSWQYLAARCLEPRARGAAMAAAHARWPDAAWPLLGTGEASAARGEYEWAEVQLTSACHALPAHCDAFLPELIRVRRAAGRDPFAGLPLADTPYRSLLPGGPIDWPRQLARGDLDAAIAAASAVAPLDAAAARWLAAASDGEPLARLDVAETEGADAASEPEYALLAYALRRRAGRAAATDLDEAVHAAAADRGIDAATDAAALRGFLAAITADATAAIDAPAADAALGPVRPVVRGRAYAAAVVLLGPRCPPVWRTLARQLLLDHERPWLRATGL